MELWLNNGKLVEEEQWGRLIEKLRAETGSFIEDEKKCVELIKKEITKSVERRMLKKCGVLLSGGVDSSLIALLAQKLKGNFVCYTVGVEGAKDVLFARKVASQLGVELKAKILTVEEVEDYIKKAVKILKKVQLVDSVSVGVSAVIMAAVDVAKKDGIDVFFSGLGAEEIFGGYLRHVKVDDVHNECWRGLKRMWGRDLVRDAAIGGELGVSVFTPFLDTDLIKAAMRVPGKFKIVDAERKVVLRKAAEELGVLKEVAWRKKSAAMYGSSFDKVLGKLAKKSGLQKGEYLEHLGKVF